MNTKTLNRLIFILSLAGIAMAVYVLQSFLRASSIVCLTGGGCEAVRKHAASWPLGIPVPAFGLAGYTGMAILSFLRTMNDKPGYLKGILGIAIFGVSFVTWFTYTEIFIIHGICMWCAISALTMVVIFALTLASFRRQPRATGAEPSGTTESV